MRLLRKVMVRDRSDQHATSPNDGGTAIRKQAWQVASHGSNIDATSGLNEHRSDWPVEIPPSMGAPPCMRNSMYMA